MKSFLGRILLLALILPGAGAKAVETKLVPELRLVGVIHTFHDHDQKKRGQASQDMAIIKNTKSGQTLYLRLGDPVSSTDWYVAKIAKNLIHLQHFETEELAYLRYDGSKESPKPYNPPLLGVSGSDFQEIRRRADKIIGDELRIDAVRQYESMNEEFDREEDPRYTRYEEDESENETVYYCENEDGCEVIEEEDGQSSADDQ